MKTLISVINPTRTRAHTLLRFSKTSNIQKFKNSDFLVCDDASNDKTVSLLRRFTKKSKFKIRIFHDKVTAGKPKIDNSCISKSKLSSKSIFLKNMLCLKYQLISTQNFN